MDSGPPGRFPLLRTAEKAAVEKVATEKAATEKGDRDMDGPPTKYARRSPEVFRGAPPDPYGRENGSGRRPSYMSRREPEPKLTCWDYLMSLHQYKMDQRLPDTLDKGILATTYENYKKEFAGKQRKKFFEENSKTEWMVEKYHPDGIEARQKARQDFALKRKEVFDKLQEMGAMDGLSLTSRNAFKIHRLMDSAIVLLEGGSDDDLEAIKQAKIDHFKVYRYLVDEEEFEIEKNRKDDADTPKTDLHETQSVVFAEFPFTQTAKELEAIGKGHPFFCRSMLTDPVATKEGLSRKGYLTFKMRTDIKEVCLKLNHMKLGPVTILEAPVPRVRDCRGPFEHKPVTEAFLHKALQLICKFDGLARLYTPEDFSPEAFANDLIIGTDLVDQSTNPLVEKFREMVPAGVKDDSYFQSETEIRDESLEEDPEKIAALDTLAYYLRIVHSFDLYSFKKYENEDSSPSRLGIFHVRCPLVQERRPAFEDRGIVEAGYIVKVLDDIKANALKYLRDPFIGQEELVELGWEDPEAYVQKFIADNTKELGPDKWLCPLSGKKFKSAEFVLKHLTSKHQDALDGARKEAVYWNNFLGDRKRVMGQPRSLFDEEEPTAYETRRPRHLSPPRRFAPKPKFSYRDLDAAPEATAEVPNIF